MRPTEIFEMAAMIASYVMLFAGNWVISKLCSRGMVAEGVMLFGVVILLFAMSRLLMP